MEKDNLIVPIRTRGAIRTREEREAQVPSTTPIRTRGAIRGRAISLAEVPAAAEAPVTIEALLERLRGESGSFPLTAVVYGWGSKQAEEFVSKLHPHRWKGDALVLLPSKRAEAAAAPVPEGAVLLNKNRSSYQHAYENGNLPGDLVFIGEPEEWGASEVERWVDSARAVIVAEEDPHADLILSAVRKAKLFGYLWSGENLRLAN